MPVVDNLYDVGVFSVLDYSVEGKEGNDQLDSTLNKILELTDFSETKKAMPFSVFKPTGLGRFELYQKISENIELSDEEVKEWERVVNRVDKDGIVSIILKKRIEKQKKVIIN